MVDQLVIPFFALFQGIEHLVMILKVLFNNALLASPPSGKVKKKGKQRRDPEDHKYKNPTIAIHLKKSLIQF